VLSHFDDPAGHPLKPLALLDARAISVDKCLEHFACWKKEEHKRFLAAYSSI